MEMSFWLVPSANDRRTLQKIISNLATRYDAPRFEPHLTLYVGSCNDLEAIKLVDSVATRSTSLTLAVDGIEYTNIFTKTIFISFSESPTLRAINEAFRVGASKPSTYILRPHLSLLYKKMEEDLKKTLVANISIPPIIHFDEIKGIATPAIVDTKADVECWREVCSKKLLP